MTTLVRPIPAQHQSARRRIFIGVLAFALLTPCALAQQASGPPIPADVVAGLRVRFNGKDFGGVDLPGAPQEDAVTFAARRGWAWMEGASNRLMLERDVVVQLGLYEFRARRAHVWIEPVFVDERPADQIAVYFEDVRTPLSGPTAHQGDRLLVTGVFFGETRTLQADVLREDRPTVVAVDEAEARLARFLQELLLEGTTDRPSVRQRDPSAIDLRFEDDRPPLPPAVRTPALFPREGTVSFFADDIRFVGRDEGESALVLSGGVAVQVNVFDGTTRSYQLEAQRAVVFLSQGADPGLARYSDTEVEGVYAEGDISVTDGDYTMRGSRVFFDVATERAMAVDAVFWTYDEDRGMSLYLRADAIRQEADNQWSGQDVTLSNVAFAEPHFAIGVSDLTLTRGVGSSGAPKYTVEAEGVGFEIGGVPVLGLPSVSGELRPSPLREVGYENDAGDNIIRTRWDLFTLFGADAGERNRADLLLDGYIERGPAGGVDLEWADDGIFGSAFGYYIFDSGTDKLTTGARIDRDNDHRGIALFENIWRFDREWALFLEGSYISDEAFVDAFFEEWAEERREFTNSAYLRYLDEQAIVSLEARGTFNDFIANEYLLQSQGFQVERLPEVSGAVIGQEGFGLLSYSGEAQFSRIQANFSEPRLRDYGLDNAGRADAAFPGLTPDDRLSEQFRAAGFTEDPVNRFDTRHEVEVPLAAGPFNIVPFAVGRFTAYDTDFADFRGPDGPDDEMRFWGAAGVRAQTSIVRIDESASSELFDVDRIRHIIEPGLTVWQGDSSLDSSELPTYDDSVEALAEGTVVRAGMRNTWQTKRGRPGEKYSVDWMVFDLDYVWSSEGATRESPFGRFDEARPELSALGEYLHFDGTMQLTDAVAVVGEIVHDFEEKGTARASAGMRVDHGDGVLLFLETRYLDGYTTSLVRAGTRLELTKKYAIGLAAGYNVAVGEVQNAELEVERRFPQFTFLGSIDLDEIADRVSIGLTVRPVGFEEESRRRPFTYEEDGLPVPDRSPRRLAPGRIRSGPLSDPR